MTNPSDAFFSGGQGLNYGPTTDTRWLGRPRGGVIVSEPREEQQTDINTRQPLFWDDARTRPKMQLVFTVVCDGSGPAQQNGWNTNERVDAQDQGHRSVYVKGKDKVEAIKAQLQKHGRPGLRIGDHYYECWTGTRPGQNNIGTARTWAVMLFPGAGQQQTQFFGNEQQAPQGQPAAPSGFGQAPPAQGQTAYVPPSQISGPAGPAQHPGPPPQFGAPAQQPASAAQGNAFGFGHQPPASPGGQAYAAAQQPAQGFGQPSYQSGDAQHAISGQQAPNGFGQAPPAAPPVRPVDDPWGQAPAVQNPYGG